MMMTTLDHVVAFVTKALMRMAALSRIGTVPGLVASIPTTVLLVGHCLAVAGMTKKAYSGRFMSYVLGLLLAFGGNLAASFFVATPGTSILFTSNQAVLTWTICWWLVNHNPLVLLEDLFDLSIVGTLARACVQVLRAQSICNSVYAAARLYPGVVAPAVIAGTLAGCGGKILCDGMESVAGLKAQFELANPSFLLRSSVVNSAVVYLVVYVLRAFTMQEAVGFVIVVSLLRTLTDDLVGQPVDYSEHVTNVFTTITLIAAPAASVKATRGRKPAPKAAVGEETSTPARTSARKRSTSARRRPTAKTPVS